MVTKRIIACFLYIVIFSSAFAQSKFKQKLSWEADENALEYTVEVVSVVDESKKYSYKTESAEITFSIPAGKYKYRICAYDFLGREAQISDWKIFDITKALVPKIKVNRNPSISSLSETEIRIPAKISDIAADSVALLVNDETEQEVPCSMEISSENKKDGTVIATAVKVNGVTGGYWRIKVKNPSGLESQSDVIDVSAYFDELARIQAEKERLEEEKRLAEEAAEKARIEAELAEKERAEAELLAEKERQEAERRAEEEARREEERISREKAEEEKRIANEKAAKIEEEKRLAAEEKLKKRMEFIKAHTKFDMTPMLGVSAFSPFALDGLFEYSDSKFLPALTIKIYYLPVLIKTVSLGVNAEAGFSKMSGSTSLYTMDFPITRFETNFVWQKELKKNLLYWNLKAGANAFIVSYDLEYIKNYTARESPAEKDYGYLGAQFGTSLWIQPVKKIVCEIGADLVYEPINGMQTMYFDPHICMGFRF